MERRAFLKGTMATGVLVAAGVPLLSSCSGVKISDLPSSEEAAKGIDEEIARILWYASLAPSGHNSQPWFVKVAEKGKWIIGGDPKRRLPAVDPDNRELLLSIGAFAETSLSPPRRRNSMHPWVVPKAGGGRGAARFIQKSNSKALSP
jgi:hypothetical protein